MAEGPGTALVTGSTGFLGSHLVDVLLEAGYRVRCLIRATSRLRWLEGKPVELHEADLVGGDLTSAVVGVDLVFHFAALTRGSKHDLWAANHEGTRALLTACVNQGELSRFVFCSSQAAAGPSTAERPREESDDPAPTSEYGRSKLAAEEEVLGHGDRFEVVVLRPAAAYGPRDADTLPYFQMAARGVMLVPGVRKRRLQLVHGHDVAEAARLAAEREKATGRTYFLAHPDVVTWGALAWNIGRAMGRRVLIVRLPSAVVRGAGAAAELFGGGRQPGQLDRRRARDLSEPAWTCRVDRALGELGWSPEYDLERGLLDTANWYRENGWV